MSSVFFYDESHTRGTSAVLRLSTTVPDGDETTIEISDHVLFTGHFQPIYLVTHLLTSCKCLREREKERRREGGKEKGKEGGGDGSPVEPSATGEEPEGIGRHHGDGVRVPG